MKVKSIPKPPPLCTYVHASHVLMHSLHFIQKHKDPEMLSPFLKALIQMHPYIPECGFFLALLSRGWEGLCFQALDLTFQENKCSEAFKVSDLLSCLWVCMVETCHLSFRSKHATRTTLWSVMPSTMGGFDCFSLVLSAAVLFENWFWCCLLSGFSPFLSIWLLSQRSGNWGGRWGSEWHCSQAISKASSLFWVVLVALTTGWMGSSCAGTETLMTSAKCK